MMKLNVNPHDDYATVTEVYENMSVVHHTMLSNTPKHKYPFVLVRQVLPAYKDVVVRLDKLGLTKENQRVEYSYYFNESRDRK